ncbi:MAG: FtsW/RodA/SpoVE family cell cycle protein [Ilumatobacteraceae bacterium]
MSARTTVVGDRRRVASHKQQARRRHPAQRRTGLTTTPPTPPPVAFYVISVVAVIFTLLGLVMVLSASSVSQFHRGSSPWRIFQRQAWWAGFGIFGLWVAMKVPLHRVRPFVGAFAALSTVLMVLPFAPGIGVTVNGARAWVEIGQLTFQPSEFLKLALLLQCAHLIAGRRRDESDLMRAVGPVAVFAVVGLALCLAQGDFGSGVVLATIVFAMLFMAGAPLGPMVGVAATAFALGSVLVMSSPRRAARFTAFLDLAGTKDDFGYQVWQARIGIAQGGVAGAGIGRGLNKLGEFLPLAHSDFIFAVIVEELGLVGMVVVLGGFCALLYSAMQVAHATQDRFHTMVAAGIGTWLAAQAAINVGGVTGLLPLTGLTLPFFSAGGSSLLVTLAATGLLLNVARNVR